MATRPRRRGSVDLTEYAAGSALAWIESAWDTLSALWSAATGTSIPTGNDDVRRPSSGSTSTPNDGGSCIDPNGAPCA